MDKHELYTLVEAGFIMEEDITIEEWIKILIGDIYNVWSYTA